MTMDCFAQVCRIEPAKLARIEIAQIRHESNRRPWRAGGLPDGIGLNELAQCPRNSPAHRFPAEFRFRSPMCPKNAEFRVNPCWRFALARVGFSVGETDKALTSLIWPEKTRSVRHILWPSKPIS